MKLILTQEVSGLGAPGDVVEVKDGYGRNFLLPRGLATGWTKGGEKQVASIQAARSAREIHNLEDAQALKGKLEDTTVTVSANAGKSGRLFGAVTPSDIAAAIKTDAKADVDKRKIEIKNPIRIVGAHRITVRLHAEVLANLEIEVVPSA